MSNSANPLNVASTPTPSAQAAPPTPAAPPQVNVQAGFIDPEKLKIDVNVGFQPPPVLTRKEKIKDFGGKFLTIAGSVFFGMATYEGAKLAAKAVFGGSADAPPPPIDE